MAATCREYSSQTSVFKTYVLKGVLPEKDVLLKSKI